MNRQVLKRSFYTKHHKLEPIIKLEDGSRLISKVFSGETVASEELLPPRVRNYPKRSILSKEQIKEMKDMRRQDPDRFTVLQLAKKFNTFPGFVLKHTQISPERKEKLELEEMVRFENLKLSDKKRMIDRMRRKALW